MMQRFSATSFVSGIMIGVLLAGAWFLSANPAFAPEQPSSRPTSSSDSQLQKSGAVSVADQPSGDSVVVESVTVPPPGVWITVREIQSSGDLGNVLGATRVVGPHTNVTVSLLRPTEVKRSYAVELYRDDNNGVFDLAINSVYVDFDTGARVVSYFTTTK